MWFSLHNLVLIVIQAACVVLPAAGLPRWAIRLRGRAWAAVLPVSIVLVIVGISILPSTADVLTWIALIGVPVGCTLALGWAARGARAPLALLAVPLLALAWVAPDAAAGQLATTLLIAGSAITLGRLLAGATPLAWLRGGVYLLAAVDAYLVFSGALESPNQVLVDAAPGPDLPQLQSASFGPMSIGYGDFFIAGVVGGILAVERGPQLLAGVLTLVLALAWDQLFLVYDVLPATIPPALALLCVELLSRRRRLGLERKRRDGRYDRHMRGALALAAVIAGALVCAVPRADAFVYWSSGNGAHSTIGRANLDGTAVEPGLVSGVSGGSGVATDGSHIYWGESGSGSGLELATIGRAEPDGSAVDRDFLPATAFCGVFGLRADADAIFWIKGTCNLGLNTVDRYDAEGFGPAGGGTWACGFDVDDTYVYWSEGNFIARGLRSGEEIDRTWLDLGAGHEACGVAVDDDHIFWSVAEPTTGGRGRSIGRASIDGSESTIDRTFIDGAVFDRSIPVGIAAQGNRLFWTNSPESGLANGYGSIGRAFVDGTNVDQAFIPHVLSPTGLDVDYGRTGCRRAESALQRARDRLGRLRAREAAKRAIKRAERTVRKRQAAAAAACG